MDWIISLFTTLFPNTTAAHWMMALTGFCLLHLLRVRHVKCSKFKLHRWMDDNLIFVMISFLAMTICLSLIPQMLSVFTMLDALLIGFSATQLLQEIFKQRSHTIVRKVAAPKTKSRR